jgi:HAD superfamily hydrolase (TIGR01450 family)
MTWLAEQHDVLLLDLDGVVYVGPNPVPWAVEGIRSAAEQGLRSMYVTNNASRTPHEVAEHLRTFGLAVDPQDVVTSAMAGASLLAGRVTGGPVLAVGGEGVSWALREKGFLPTADFDGETVAVLQGYGPGVGWRDLAEATFAVRAGLPWIATNMDFTFPTARGPAPGNGSLVRVVADVAGRQPDGIAGKPEPALLEEAIRRSGSRRPLMIGDRLDTDIAGGSRLGIPTLLVLTGIADAAQLRAAEGDERPTHVAEDLRWLMPGFKGSPSTLEAR